MSAASEAAAGAATETIATGAATAAGTAIAIAARAKRIEKVMDELLGDGMTCAGLSRSGIECVLNPPVPCRSGTAAW
jgi:hypothetical protein